MLSMCSISVQTVIDHGTPTVFFEVSHVSTFGHAERKVSRSPIWDVQPKNSTILRFCAFFQ